MTKLPDGSMVIEAAPLTKRDQPGGDQAASLAGGSLGPATLDPALIRDAESVFVARQIFRGLVSLDNELEVQPELAERIEISPNGQIYTFTLWPDLTFHNGATLDTSAVISSFERATDPQLGDGVGLPAASYLDDIQGVAERIAGLEESISGLREIDARTLAVRLVRPAANFLMKLTGSPAWIVDVDTATTAEWWHAPNGSGPFEVASFQPGEELRLEPFDEFVRGRPFLETVEIRYGSNALQPLNLYERGDIDLTELPGYAIDRALSETDYLGRDLRIVPELSTQFIALNPNVPPFDDPALRSALALLVNRPEIVAVGFAGRVEAAQGLVPPGILDRTWPAELPGYDPLAAQELMANRQVEETPQIFDPGGGMAVLLKDVAARELDLELEAVAPPWPEFVDALNSRELPAFVLSWVADYPDPASFLTTLFHSLSPDNYVGYANPEVDELLEEAGAELDPERRATLYLEAQQTIIDDGVLIPLYHGVSHMVVQPEVQNLDISPIGILGLEDVWIAS